MIGQPIIGDNCMRASPYLFVLPLALAATACGHRTTKPVEKNTSSAKQVESLTRLIDELDREVKQISHKVDQLQK